MAKIQLRRDTAANWTSADPTLSSGEIGFETDTNKFKFGDGATAWASLSYFESGSGDLTYQTPLTVSTTFSGTKKGLNNVYPVNSASNTVMTIDKGTYAENDVIIL